MNLDNEFNCSKLRLAEVLGIPITIVFYPPCGPSNNLKSKSGKVISLSNNVFYIGPATDGGFGITKDDIITIETNKNLIKLITSI